MTAAGLILILKDGKPRQEVDLTWGQYLSMGTHPSNSIILPDKGIQPEHMKLLVDEEGQASFDSFGHKNVLVNGRVEQGPVTLNDGDLIEVLRKHHGPRQFVYYSKSSGQTSVARKSLQQEPWPLKGPGPSETSLLASKAPQTSPMPPALLGQTPQIGVQPPGPAPQQQQFAMPPPAPPCPPGPWLTQHQVAKLRSQGRQSAQLHSQHQDPSAPGPTKAPAALPPVPPPLPPLPWLQEAHGAATKEQQAWRQQQQQQQSLQKKVQLQPAPAPPAPPLPSLLFAKHVTTSSAPANTPPQQSSRPGSSAQFAQPPVPPPPPPQPKPSKGNTKASCGKSQDVGVQQQQQQQQPNCGHGASVEVKGPSTISDVQSLVAQQAAAASLKRRQHLDQPERSSQPPPAAAATPADTESDKRANLQHQLSQKCGEVETLHKQNMQLQAQVNALQKCGKAAALQEQNMLLQAQVKALQQQLVCSSMAGCSAKANHADAALESLEAAQELIEPTVVLQFPPQAASGMHHNQAAACATDTDAQAQEDSLASGGTSQHPTYSQGTDCCTAQNCSQMAGSLENSTVAQPEQSKHAHVPSAPCLQARAAVSQSPRGTVQQQADASRTAELAMLSGGTVTLADGQQATAPAGQTGSPEGQAPAPGGQTRVPEAQATVINQQSGGTEGQTKAANGQAAKLDLQGSAADGHDATTDKHTALTNGVPAHMSDTISEACCVCNSAEDGEVMLLCDKCNRPAHLGCVGVDTVPEGDWFCPSCISVMVLQSKGAKQTGHAAARPAVGTDAGAGQRQGPMESSQNDVDAGQGSPQGKKQQAGKKRKGVPSSADDTDANQMPSRKRSKRSVPPAQCQAGKENLAANATSTRQRQGKRASQPAPHATCNQVGMDSCGPRRSTRLAHK